MHQKTQFVFDVICHYPLRVSFAINYFLSFNFL